MDKEAKIKIVAKNYYDVDGKAFEKSILASLRASYEKGFLRGVEKEAKVKEAKVEERWYIFSSSEDYDGVEANDYPCLNEKFLLYRKEQDDIIIQTWAPHCFCDENKTLEGYEIVPGDAWMPKPEGPYSICK